MGTTRAAGLRSFSGVTRHQRPGGVLKGCLIALAIVVVIAIAIGIWVAVNLKGWTANIMKAATASAVQQSQLAPEQKTRITTRINALADDFKAGKVSYQQLIDVLEEIADGPLLPMGIVYAAEEKYIKPSALTTEEKKAGVLAMQRLARGIFEKKIPKDARRDVLAPISVVGSDGEIALKDQVTTEELKEFLARAKKEADKAGIPDEPFNVNVADEIDKAIDKALAKPGPG